MKLQKGQILVFQKEILDWFAANKRDLPWRHARDPYSILVSEVMLQQTQVDRVVPKFLSWMKKFSTIESLTKASTRDVLLLWSGLGYNRRALYLKKLAQQIVENYSRVFPHSEEELMKLPGIGKYTARAILCFAFDIQIAVVDTNVRKVILTQFKNVEDNPKIVQEVADQLLPKGSAYEWNQALMDYASAMLKKEKISIPKQKRFKDSDRFFRGEILRQLLTHQRLRGEKLFQMVHEKSVITKDRFQKILAGMEKDMLLTQKGNMISIVQH